MAGQEVRRAVSAHSLHQTHSFQSNSSANFDEPLRGGQARSLSTCAICARSHWAEELVLLNLWVQPTSNDLGAEVEILEDDAFLLQIII